MSVYTPRQRQLVQWSGFLAGVVCITALAELRRYDELQAQREADQRAGAIALVLINAMRLQDLEEQEAEA